MTTLAELSQQIEQLTKIVLHQSQQIEELKSLLVKKPKITRQPEDPNQVFFTTEEEFYQEYFDKVIPEELDQIKSLWQKSSKYPLTCFSLSQTKKHLDTVNKVQRLITNGLPKQIEKEWNGQLFTTNSYLYCKLYDVQPQKNCHWREKHIDEWYITQWNKRFNNPIIDLNITPQHEETPEPPKKKVIKRRKKVQPTV
jgi:hypothetical protein